MIFFLKLGFVTAVMVMVHLIDTRNPKYTPRRGWGKVTGALCAISLFFAFCYDSMPWRKEVGQFNSTLFHQGELQPVLGLENGWPPEMTLRYNRRSWWGLKDEGWSTARQEGADFVYWDAVEKEWRKVPLEVQEQSTAKNQTLW